MVVVTSTDDPFLVDRLTREELEVCPQTDRPGSLDDARATSQLATERDAAWIAVDGYRFGADFQDFLADNAHQVLWVDDYGHVEHYRAQVVLNQNLHADQRLYARRDPHTQLLLGHRFILLRHEFLRWAGKARETFPGIPSILVIAGGVDSTGLAGRILRTLTDLDLVPLQLKCIVHESDQTCRSLAANDHRISLVTRTHDLSALMAESHLAISAAGSTAWELAFMGVPALLVSVAENQRPIAAELHSRGAAIDLGWHTELDAALLNRQLQELLSNQETRSAMANSAQELVDGEGVDRVISCLLAEPLRLRPVCHRDRRLIWEWANDPEVRQASLSTEPIPWTDHVAWFDHQLASDAGPFWLAVDETETPVGHIRFDLSASKDANVHIAMGHGHRGRGHGPLLLSLATERLFHQHRADRVHAYIKPENSASLKAFHRAGYRQVNDATVKGEAVKHYVVERPA